MRSGYNKHSKDGPTKATTRAWVALTCIRCGHCVDKSHNDAFSPRHRLYVLIQNIYLYIYIHIHIYKYAIETIIAIIKCISDMNYVK